MTANPEATERTCVCGHGESWHGALSKQCYEGDSESGRECRKFHPMLDWPTEEGWWYVQSAIGKPTPLVAQIAYYDDEDNLWFATADAPVVLKSGESPLRFTKCEPSPFPNPEQGAGA